MSLLNNTLSFADTASGADEPVQTGISLFVDILNKPSLRSFPFELSTDRRAKGKKRTLNLIYVAFLGGEGTVLTSLADLRLYGTLRINKNIENFSLADAIRRQFRLLLI